MDATKMDTDAGPARDLYRVRAAGSDDLAAIVTLLAALGYGRQGEVVLAATLDAVLSRDDMAVFLVVDRMSQPVGLIHLSRRPQLHLGGTIVTIDALAVVEVARGRGVGRRLLRRARAFARRWRAVRLEVHTNRRRESYRRGFYVANGYQEANSALLRLADLERPERNPRLPEKLGE